MHRYVKLYLRIRTYVLSIGSQANTGLAYKDYKYIEKLKILSFQCNIIRNSQRIINFFKYFFEHLQLKCAQSFFFCQPTLKFNKCGHTVYIFT